MPTVLTAIWPVFGLLVTGYLLKRINFPDAIFWPLAEKMTYYVLFPALLVNRLSQAQLEGQQSLKIVMLVLLLLLLGSFCVFIAKRFVAVSAPAFTSLYQGGMRFNTFIALSVSALLLPESGVVLGAVITAVMIPTLNLLCILVFAVYGEGKASLIGVIKALCKNPLILACVLGIFLNLSGIGAPGPITPILGLLGQMALPMGLLAVGAALEIRALGNAGAALYSSMLVKLVLFPLIAWGLALMMGLSETARQACIIFASVPTATSAYILARQLGGDAQLMASIITVQTLVAMLTMPLVYIILL